ncbi:MAG: PHP domain-containing protein [Candidatus Thorarchaeota archaeon]|nr:PHP domain-containing protein [Candidatus Thorarchaeota archaeon]
MQTLKQDLHTHTTFSDGSSTVEEVIGRAAQVHLDVLAITDHFWPSLGGIKGGVEIIEERRTAIEQAASQYPKLRVLDGAEVDIQSDGTFASVAGGLDQFDIVIGSLHYYCDSTQWASIMLRALRLNSFHIVGHWDGYLSSYRPEDGDIVAKALADYGVAVELSSRYVSEHEDFFIMARDYGCVFTLGSDSHHASTVGDLDDQRALAQALDLPLLDI